MGFLVKDSYFLIILTIILRFAQAQVGEEDFQNIIKTAQRTNIHRARVVSSFYYYIGTIRDFPASTILLSLFSSSIYWISLPALLFHLPKYILSC